MSKAQTDGYVDNDVEGFNYKVSLRVESIKHLKNVRVLDTFHGHGHVWAEVKKHHKGKIDVVGIDVRLDKTAAYLKGDNLKYLPTMDLNQFDLIDADAYGGPDKVLEIVFNKQFHGIVHATFIQVRKGRVNKSMLNALGYTDEMYKKIPLLFSKNGFTKMTDWLSIRGVKEVNYISVESKHYFYFSI